MMLASSPHVSTAIISPCDFVCVWGKSKCMAKEIGERKIQWVVAFDGGLGKAKTEPRKQATDSQRKKSIIHSSYHLRLIKEMPKAAGSAARIRLQC